MGQFLLSLLLRPKVLVGLSLAVMVGAISIQSVRLAHCKTQLSVARAALLDPETRKPWKTEAAAARVALVQCVDRRAELEASLQAQNAAVDRAHAEGERLRGRLSDAVHAATRSGAHDRALAAHILAGRRGADACRSADLLILESLNKELDG